MMDRAVVLKLAREAGAIREITSFADEVSFAILSRFADLVEAEVQGEVERLQTCLFQMQEAAKKHLADAERYKTFRELVKKDHIRAQAMVWNSDKQRKKFDAFVDAAMKEE